MKITRTVTINHVEFMDIKDGIPFNAACDYYGDLTKDKIIKLHNASHPNTLIISINRENVYASWDVKDIIKCATIENKGDNK